MFPRRGACRPRNKRKIVRPSPAGGLAGAKRVRDEELRAAFVGFQPARGPRSARQGRRPRTGRARWSLRKRSEDERRQAFQHMHERM